MILCIGDVLDEITLARLSKTLAGAVFEDGRATAGWSARLVKNNRQLVSGTPLHKEVTQTVIDALHASATLQSAALPRSYRPPLITRYDTGMGYGSHVDDALMGQPPTRADLSYTLFMSPPEAYEGGELILEDTQGEHSFKLPAGGLVIYPATYLHRVETIRSGVRTVAAGWIQSVCRSAAAREILFDLHRVITTEFEQRGKTAEFDLLAKARSNLLRLLAEV